MKNITFFFILILNCNLYSQTIKFLEIDSKNPVSNVFVKVEKNNKNSKFFNSNENGIVEHDFGKNDSIYIETKHIGFIDFKGNILNTNSITIIYLEPINYEINEVIVSAQIDSTKLNETVYNIKTISRKKIDESAAVNLSELLSQSSLFDIQYDPFLGSGLSIQGLSGNNMNIMIDGVPMIGRKGSQIDISQINLSLVEKVEILKGPASVSYGTNSTGGLINLISKNSVLDDKITYKQYHESVGVNQSNLFLQKKINQTNLLLNVGTYIFDGINTDSLRQMEWRPKDQVFGQLLVKTKLKDINIKLKKYIFNEILTDLGNENFAPFQNTANDNTFETKRVINDINLDYKNKEYSINALIAQSNTKFIKKQYLTDLIFNTETQTDDQNYNATDEFISFFSRFEFNKLNLNSVKFQLGSDYRYEQINGPKIIDNVADIREFSIFSQSEIFISPRFKTQVGIRFPYHSVYDAPITPSIHFKYSVNPELNFKFSYARGFRAPSIKELYMEFIDSNHNIVGNDNLEAEFSNAINSSITFFPIKTKNSYLRLDFEPTLQYLSNRISLAQIENSFAYTYFNLSKSVFSGINTILELKLNNININFGYNFFRLDSENYLEPIKRQNLSLNYNHNFNKYKLGYNFILRHRTKTIFESLVNEEISLVKQPSYSLLNFNIYKFLNNTENKIIVGLKNILNVKDILNNQNSSPHSSSVAIISWGRSFFIELNIKF